MNQCSICFAISDDNLKYCRQCGEELQVHQDSKESKNEKTNYLGLSLLVVVIAHFIVYRDPLIFLFIIVAYIVRMKFIYNWRYKKYDKAKLKEKEQIQESEFRDLVNELSSN